MGQGARSRYIVCVLLATGFSRSGLLILIAGMDSDKYNKIMLVMYSSERKNNTKGMTRHAEGTYRTSHHMADSIGSIGGEEFYM